VRAPPLTNQHSPSVALANKGYGGAGSVAARKNRGYPNQIGTRALMGESCIQQENQ
jgi:hypothetical protein